MDNITLSNMGKTEWRAVRNKYVNVRVGMPNKKFDLAGRTSNLKEVKQVLDDVGLKFWLTNGTALAAHRDHDWIPWDDDVDLDVYMEDFRPLCEKLRTRFMKRGYIARLTKGARKCKMSVFKHGEKTAFRGLFLDPSYKKNKYRLRTRFKYPKRFYKTRGTLEFKGMVFNVPSPIEDFLVYVYGKKWRVPMRSDDQSKYSTREILR